MAQIETLENAIKQDLQTHYYKASYDQIKEVYLETSIPYVSHNVFFAASVFL